MTRCTGCGREGRHLRWWTTPERNNLWKVLRCDNPACRFTFTPAFGGKEMTGRPTWMVPWKDVAGAGAGLGRLSTV